MPVAVLTAAVFLVAAVVAGALRSRGYGAGAWHGLALLVTLLVGGYAMSRLWLLDGQRAAIAVWFVGAIVAHDLLLFRSTPGPTGLCGRCCVEQAAGCPSSTTYACRCCCRVCSWSGHR